jgi:subtilisin family serine protease
VRTQDAAAARAIARPSGQCMTGVELVKLGALTKRTSGSANLAVALLDGPVATNHPDLAGASIRDLPGIEGIRCAQAESSACVHGTFVAGILVARAGSPAPAICPGCTLVVRPIFSESTNGWQTPTATPSELARAVIECVDAGARILNLSAATGGPSTRNEGHLERALDYAARRGALVVVAAGNQAAIGSSAITRHPGVVPVVAYDRRGRPMEQSNLGGSIGRRGLGGPGEEVESLGTGGRTLVGGGTSAAAAFVTGSAALLWSLFPSAGLGELRLALTGDARRRTVVPPLLDAEAAHSDLSRSLRGVASAP